MASTETAASVSFIVNDIVLLIVYGIVLICMAGEMSGITTCTMKVHMFG